MAAINNSINLTDRMSPVLKTVLKALDSTMKAMDQLDRATNKGMNSAAFKRAKADIDAANAAVSSLNGSLSDTETRMNKIESAANKAASAVASIPGRMRRKGDSIIKAAERDMMYNRAQGNVRGVIANRLSMGGGYFLSALGSMPSKISSFTSVVSSGFDTISNRCKLAYTETLSFINLVEKGIGAINGLMSANDAVTSDVAKIGLFNYDKNMSNAQAYGMAYRAAQNSRSDLSDTTTLINRIMMSGVYGQKAGSLGSATRMAEILNKAMVVGGGTAEENKRALIQLSQGLSSGVLQGDELRSIREQAPYLASVLAEGLNKIDDRFIGTTVGDLKELGAQGELTSDVVIRALEAMQDQVDATFADKAPRTWAQGLTSIKNTIKVMTAYLQSMEGGPLSKISELVWIIADYLKSEDGIRLLAGIATGLSVVGTVLTWVVQAALTGISWLMDHSYVLIAVLVVLASMAVIAGIQMAAAWIAATWPLLLVIVAIAAVIGILQVCGVSFSQIVGAICGGIAVVIAAFKNFGLAVWEIIANIGIFLYNLFAVDFPSFVLEGVLMAIQMFSPLLDLISAIGNVLGQDWDITATLSNGVLSRQAELESKRKDFVDTGAFQDGWVSDAYNSGYEWGAGAINNLTDGIGDITSGIANFMEGNTALYDSATGAGVNVAGGNLDSVGSIKNDVNINDEDIQLLRDMAARDYLLNLQQITPVAHISFGDVRETADVNKIMDVIEDMVEEQMATSLVSN